MTDSTDPMESEADDPPRWLDLADGERLRWRGTRRIWVVLPTVVGGLLFVLAGLAVLLSAAPIDTALGLALGVPLLAIVSLAAVGWQVLAVRNTEYVVTDEHLYRRSGVLSHKVTTVDFTTVQNITYSQSITGTLFDHGSLEFDTAGGSGTELVFRDIDDPRHVESLINDQLARVRGSETDSAPGTVEQWEAVLDEVRTIRRRLEA